MSILIPFDSAMSVNRSKYSEPGDVLYSLYPKYIDWGVAEFRVEDLPASLESEDESVFEWKVEHAPEEGNYAHSEVRTYRNGIYSRGLDPPKLVKKRFRLIMSDRIKLAILPSRSSS